MDREVGQSATRVQRGADLLAIQRPVFFWDTIGLAYVSETIFGGKTDQWANQRPVLGGGTMSWPMGDRCSEEGVVGQYVPVFAGEESGGYDMTRR